MTEAYDPPVAATGTLEIQHLLQQGEHGPFAQAGRLIGVIEKHTDYDPHAAAQNISLFMACDAMTNQGVHNENLVGVPLRATSGQLVRLAAAAGIDNPLETNIHPTAHHHVFSWLQGTDMDHDARMAVVEHCRTVFMLKRLRQPTSRDRQTLASFDVFLEQIAEVIAGQHPESIHPDIAERYLQLAQHNGRNGFVASARGMIDIIQTKRLLRS